MVPESLADGLRHEIRDARDRFVASDPGWARLRLGIRAFVAVATTLAVMYGFAKLTGQPVTLAMLLGAVVAMLMSTGIRESRRRVIAQTAAAAPVVAAVGVSLGVLTSELQLLGLLTFVAVSFVAVWVRRFGPRWFTLGFLLWQGFFFALFLHPPLATLPYLLASVGISGLWVGLLLLTALYDDPDAKLRRIVNALRARARAAIAAAAEVLDHPDDKRKVESMRRNSAQLMEIALLLDAQLADARALPDRVRPARLRRWIVDVEIGLDEVCRATVAIADQRADLSPATLDAVRRALDALGWGQHDAALRAAAELVASEQGPTVKRLGTAATFLLRVVNDWDSGQLEQAPQQNESYIDPLDEDFEPVVTLISGNLPSTAKLAEQSIGRADARRLSPSRLRLTTRQAVQAAVAAGLAIAVGEAISSSRFYWAVIAAFVGFAGTATSGETLSKGIGRIAGTVTGLIAAVALANVTDGYPAVAIVLMLFCIFLAFFLQPVFYSAMVFFITVLLGQLYTLLGTFSDELLALRLAETAAGATIGILVSLLVLPAHSRATLRVARKAFLGNLADLLDSCAQTLDGYPPNRDLLALTVQLDASGRQVVRTLKSLTKGRLFGPDRMILGHRLSVLASCGAAARGLAGAITAGQLNVPLAAACAVLADEARRLGDASNITQPPALPSGTPDVLARVAPLLDEVSGDPSVSTALHAIRRLSDGLGMLGGQPGARPQAATG